MLDWTRQQTQQVFFLSMANKGVDIKVVLLGKSSVGKTSLVERYLHNRFLGDTVPYQNTIGAAYGAKKLNIAGKEVQLGIWDTAGSERYESMSRIYYRDAGAAIVCYDLTDKSSLDRANFWIQELRDNEENCKLYLCGCKRDVIAECPSKRQVERGAAEALGDINNAEVFETSSKTGENIDKLFEHIASDYLTVCLRQVKNLRESTKSFRLTDLQCKEPHKPKCCASS